MSGGVLAMTRTLGNGESQPWEILVCATQCVIKYTLFQA